MHSHQENLVGINRNQAEKISSLKGNLYRGFVVHFLQVMIYPGKELDFLCPYHREV